MRVFLIFGIRVKIVNFNLYTDPVFSFMSLTGSSFDSSCFRYLIPYGVIILIGGTKFGCFQVFC